MPEERLQKIISQSGLMSRRLAELAITSGRVSIDGKVVTELGTKADPKLVEISVDGKRIDLPQEKIVIALNKAIQTVTTKKDPQGRKTVMDFLPPTLKVNPIGRLDYETEGLLLFTNDGDLANQIMHPRYGIQKVYRARVRGQLSIEKQKLLCKEVLLEDGPGRFEQLKELRTTSQETEVEITVSEGRNRFIRRMLDAMGHPVLKLKRIQIGSIQLGALKSGEFRYLTLEEISSLRTQGSSK